MCGAWVFLTHVVSVIFDKVSWEKLRFYSSVVQQIQDPEGATVAKHPWGNHPNRGADFARGLRWVPRAPVNGGPRAESASRSGWFSQGCWATVASSALGMG